MIFKIKHTTQYTYNNPVFLEPQTIRLKPRTNASQKLLKYNLNIKPEPACITTVSDPEGNEITHAWFQNTTKTLTIQSEFEAETLLENPFNYIPINETENKLPLIYPNTYREQLAPYISGPTPIKESVAAFAQSVAKEADHQTLPFLTALNQKIFTNFKTVIRDTGDPMPAEQTLQSKKAACRDLAVLFMECTRSSGIASRFVSGYQKGNQDADKRYMHAWAEVYIPGGGWRGYDPTTGLAVAGQHIALAASAKPELAAPVTGTLRSSKAKTHMQVNLNITTE